MKWRVLIAVPDVSPVEPVGGGEYVRPLVVLIEAESRNAAVEKLARVLTKLCEGDA